MRHLNHYSIVFNNTFALAKMEMTQQSSKKNSSGHQIDVNDVAILDTLRSFSPSTKSSGSKKSTGRQLKHQLSPLPPPRRRLVVFVVVELPQTPEDDLRSARATRVRRCICVVSHVYVGLDGGRDGEGGWYACGTKPRWMVVCREMSEHFPSAE